MVSITFCLRSDEATLFVKAKACSYKSILFYAVLRSYLVILDSKQNEKSTSIFQILVHTGLTLCRIFIDLSPLLLGLIVLQFTLTSSGASTYGISVALDLLWDYIKSAWIFSMEASHPVCHILSWIFLFNRINFGCLETSFRLAPSQAFSDLRKPGLVPGESLSPSIKIDPVEEKYPT